MKNLIRSLEIGYLIDDILICNSIIRTAGSPDVIELFKKRRDEATKKLNEWR